MKKTLSLLSLLAFAAPSAAQDVIGVDWSGDTYRINLATGAGSFLGSSGFSQVNAMAKDPASGDLYAMSGSDLFKIDSTTGAGSYVATTSLNSVRGMSFGPGGVLYAVENPNPFAIDEDFLYRVDTATGATSLIGTTGYFGIQGLAFSAGFMYGWEVGNGSGTGDGLVLIDLISGLGTDVNPAINGTSSEAQCLFGDGTGGLYSLNNELYKVNTTTGALSLVGSGGYSSIRGAEVLGSGGGSPQLSVVNLVAGGVATISINAGASNGTGFVGYSLTGAGPTARVTPWGVFTFDVSNPINQLPAFALNPAGSGSINRNVPPGTTGVNVWLHALSVNAPATSAQLTNSLALTIL